MLYRYSVGSIVDEEEDHLLLLDLHHEAADEIGSGVETFAIAPPQRGPYPGFEVTRTDGSRIDFSYLTSLKPPTHRQQVLNVMRDEVKATLNTYFELRQIARDAGVGPVPYAAGDHEHRRDLLPWAVVRRDRRGFRPDGWRMGDDRADPLDRGRPRTLLGPGPLAEGWFTERGGGLMRGFCTHERGDR
ncbi:DUF3223 domain-containing protein [Streptomyces sp. NPDC048370]|uniref:DUF3223 domain-containing protein n=1 Tax=Streptomyces sp. NPDC048370 TaxID=3365540 RepID=UPI00371C0E35